MRKKISTFLFAAGAATVAYIIYKLVEKNEDVGEETVSSGKSVHKRSFDKLITDQYVCDELNGQDLTAWFREKSAEKTDPVVFIIAKLTDKNAKILSLEPIPPTLDRNHALLQAVVKKDTYDVVSVRMVSFNTVQKELEEMLEQEDFIVVEDK